MQSIKNAPITTGTKVFVAADLDVPMEDGKILDTYRLDCMLPTLKYIIEKGGLPVIAGHIGRPGGKVVAALTTLALAPYFDKHLGQNKYQLMENLRFDPREELNDRGFAQELASNVDIYVNEVFSTSHREDASIVGVPELISGYAGLRLEKEIELLGGLIKKAAHPFVIIIGGAKIEDKKATVARFFEVADQILLGGRIGLQWVEYLPKNLYIPTDYAVDQLDIGPETCAAYTKYIADAKTILWAGPMGKYEVADYIKGSKAIAEAIVKATENGAYSIAGGGDTNDVLNILGLRDKFSFVSTGGGAMLEFLSKRTLPGIEALGGLSEES